MANPITALADIRRRLAKLKPERPWVDPGPAAIALLQWCLESFAAVDAGRACEIPRYGPHPRPSDAKLRVLADSDKLAARLASERAG
jgi:hypothetical protein